MSAWRTLSLTRAAAGECRGPPPRASPTRRAGLRATGTAPPAASAGRLPRRPPRRRQAYPRARRHMPTGDERRPSMRKLKQGPAAIALVVSLGLIAPGSFGGSVSADVSSNSRNFVPTTLNCDLDGDGDFHGANDKEYELVSTFSSTMWQDKNSTTVV